MTINFAISEFNISGEPIPEDIADKILKWHISPMIEVRQKLGIAMWASQDSGYRSIEWELNHGRSGNSQHCFRNKGAVDWTCSNFKYNRAKFLREIIRNTTYTRIAVYSSFIHCDYKQTPSGRRELYESGPDSKWKLKKYLS